MRREIRSLLPGKESSNLLVKLNTPHLRFYATNPPGIDMARETTTEETVSSPVWIDSCIVDHKTVSRRWS